jgi:hypothetical protein
MATEGIEGLHIETRNYGATAAFWASLGFTSDFETDHGSGRWVHPGGGPYVFIREQHDAELALRPVLGVGDVGAFETSSTLRFVQPFMAQHWGVLQGIVEDPDGRSVHLEAPLPPGERAGVAPHTDS